MDRVGNGAIVTLDPTFKRPDRDGTRGRAQRPVTLDGCVVGLVCNGLLVELMDAVYEELSKQVELAGGIRVVKAGVSIPPNQEDFVRLTSQATVAITGIGG